jgi:ABC-type multidrug transport system fused ATPase/permease subunit
MLTLIIIPALFLYISIGIIVASYIAKKHHLNFGTPEADISIPFWPLAIIIFITFPFFKFAAKHLSNIGIFLANIGSSLATTKSEIKNIRVNTNAALETHKQEIEDAEKEVEELLNYDKVYTTIIK